MTSFQFKQYEAHLLTSYVHPLIHGLLGSNQPARIAHCLGSEQHDALINTQPEYKIDVYESYEYAYTNVCGEASSSAILEEIDRINLLKHNLRNKIPGLEYLEGDHELRLGQKGLIDLMNDVFGTDGWHLEIEVLDKHKATMGFQVVSTTTSSLSCTSCTCNQTISTRLPSSHHSKFPRGRMCISISLAAEPPQYTKLTAIHLFSYIRLPFTMF
ncbi:predicted protein [Lichtheimia corymbifera JMRC:FSU:9682]|uniref:Uncharacterized protein n=1 Tax=Lichtheimia corymbifera JMRC:FSU:9682 TaxID=1263082 RepID=A0A068RKD5_9FUNG|nr:predicted protein [Lichtheimia corymbifera JMRC:FSU:9682]